jgi:CcmD family protein
MKNFESLFAAYMFVLFVFLVYEFTVARRVARLQAELDRLKEMVRHN